MCGIVGFINCENPTTLDEAVNVINHRGPDFKGIKWFPSKNTGLGHARLSIIDLSSDGNQPMYDRMNNNWIVFNGELYNYKEIRKELLKEGISFSSSTDTEVVLKAYGKWGKEALTKFNGMFAFAIYNELSSDLFICRDRLGIKPLYYYIKEDKLIFASEIKSILVSKLYVKEPDLISIHTPVHFQVSPRTGFKGIYKLESGHCATFIKSQFSIQKYWDIYPSENDISYNEAFEELDFLINDSIKLQMMSDVKIGAMLSGGLDSSLISVLMQKHMNSPLNTFTIKFDKNDLKKQGNVDDSYFAKKLAKEYNFNHHEILIKPDIVNLLPKIISHMEEPISDPAAINTYLISKEASNKGIKVLLTGMGADEVFGGYRAYLACLKANTYQTIPKSFRIILESMIRKIPSSSSSRDFKYVRWLKSFLAVASLSEHDRSLQIKNSALNNHNFNKYFNNSGNYRNSLYVNKDSEYFNRHNNISYLTKLCFVDSKIYLADHNLSYCDKAIMAASVEGRPPLIDHRIVELMFKLKPEFRIKGSMQKFLLKKVSEKYLPRDIIYRPKAPFSAPMRGWLKNELKELVNDTLSYDSISKRGIFNPDYVQQIINNNGIEDNSQIIYRLIVNELWFRNYFD